MATKKLTDEELSRRRFVDEGTEFIKITPADKVKKASDSGDQVGEEPTATDSGDQ